MIARSLGSTPVMAGGASLCADACNRDCSALEKEVRP